MELDRDSNVPVVAGEVSEVGPEQLLAGLSEQQVAVLRLMAKSKTLTEAARGANVSRAMVYRWMSGDQAFIEAQTRMLEEKKRGIKMDVLALAEDALMNVQMAVATGKDPRLCLMLLKHMGMLKPPEEPEPQL
jgi:hypothetical protein